MYKYEHPLYLCWRSIKSRCLSPSSSSWDRYGGRGIKVCDRWLDSFDLFCEDMGERPDGYSIERNDSNGDYEPSNCRWASIYEQANNKRTTVRLTVDGVTRSCTEWAKITGLSNASIRKRILVGDTDEEALRPKNMNVSKFRIIKGE